jgi:hypothetical protein
MENIQAVPGQIWNIDFALVNLLRYDPGAPESLINYSLDINSSNQATRIHCTLKPERRWRP